MKKLFVFFFSALISACSTSNTDNSCVFLVDDITNTINAQTNLNSFWQCGDPAGTAQSFALSEDGAGWFISVNNSQIILQNPFIWNESACGQIQISGTNSPFEITYLEMEGSREEGFFNSRVEEEGFQTVTIGCHLISL